MPNSNFVDVNSLNAHGALHKLFDVLSHVGFDGTTDPDDVSYLYDEESRSCIRQIISANGLSRKNLVLLITDFMGTLMEEEVGCQKWPVRDDLIKLGKDMGIRICPVIAEITDLRPYILAVA